MLGPHFEELARQFTFRFASGDTVGGRASSVGPAVVNDAKGRTHHELDVVALQRESNGSQSVLAIGEAKHTAEQRSVSDLARLEHIRSVVSAKDPSASSADGHPTNAHRRVSRAARLPHASAGGRRVPHR